MDTAADTFTQTLTIAGPVWTLIYSVILGLLAAVLGLIYAGFKLGSANRRMIDRYLERSNTERSQMRDALRALSRGQSQVAAAIERLAP